MSQTKKNFNQLDETVLNEHLGLRCIRGLKEKLFSTVVTDAFQNNRKLNGLKLLAVGFSLANWLRKQVPERRVGIVLPPGLGGIIANLAVVLADKVPVNLNFTAGRSANESALRRAEIKTVLTSEVLVGKLKDFPWPQQRLDLSHALRSLGKWSIIDKIPLILLLPSKLLATLFRVPRNGGDQEAAILFTSGSAGEPKGVVLSHRNLVANVLQVKQVLNFKPTHKLLGCLPIFHSFGFTVTIWYPLGGGPEVVTYISPLEYGKLAEIIHVHQIQLVISTPTFLRGYLKRAQAEQLQNVQMVVTGAEKLPVDLAKIFEEKFSVPVREGYGLTETSPVLSVNLLPSHLHRRGSVGHLLPGIEARVVNAETGMPQSLHEPGILEFRGPNVFNGYLNEPELTANVLHEGWFRTGDLGHMDDDGFLYIEGRISRFSKIAGEMVPHGAIEQQLHIAFEKGDLEELVFAVCSRANNEKGEELVLLSTMELTSREVLDKLHQRGLPNLWIPRTIRKVDAIPILPSGKLDLKKCRELGETA